MAAAAAAAPEGEEGPLMKRRSLFVRSVTLGAVASAGWLPLAGRAQGSPLKVGLIFSMTGPFASTGRQLEAGVRLYMAQNGDTVAGTKIEIVIKDDASNPEQAKRHAQELVINDKVQVLAGFSLTPLALAVAPVATQGKTPSVIFVAATSSVIDSSPCFIRSSFTLPQVTIAVAEWAPKNGIRRVVTLVSDYGPGLDAEAAFRERFELNGGKVKDAFRVPVRNPDFAPFLQRVRDDKPDAVFVFLPAGVGALFMKQFTERGLDKAGIKLIATGDVTEDDILNDMGDVARGVVSSHHYSADHPSEANRKFFEAHKKANAGRRPNDMALAAYDGMRVIYNALTARGRHWRRPVGGHEGPDIREPARPGADQRADARHRAGRLHPPRREEGRRALQSRIRCAQGGAGPGSTQMKARPMRKSKNAGHPGRIHQEADGGRRAGWRQPGSPRREPNCLGRGTAAEVTFIRRTESSVPHTTPQLAMT
jgi:branched-chain amino acid transport system substrate-binding protein